MVQQSNAEQTIATFLLSIQPGNVMCIKALLCNKSSYKKLIHEIFDAKSKEMFSFSFQESIDWLLLVFKKLKTYFC